jgi:cell pole-organizing protein PopZ
MTIRGLRDDKAAEQAYRSDSSPMRGSRGLFMAQAAKKQELISKETGVAVQSAFHALEQAVLIHNAWTLEDLVPLKGMVCELIRPMLKAWLDDKLPAVVERLVRTEIERRRS